MTEEAMKATLTIPAPVQTVFDVLADPTTHEAIDGTGWVRESLDGKRLTGSGQVFRMAMYHENYGGMHNESIPGLAGRSRVRDGWTCDKLLRGFPPS